MIQVELTDANGNSLNTYDVCIIHFPNEKVKYIGFLQFCNVTLQFVLRYKDGGYTPFSYSKNKHAKLEKIANISDVPKLQHYTGAHFFKTKVEAKDFMNAVELQVKIALKKS